MKIQNLTEDTTIYTSNVYLVTGTWNALSDQNTLIDVGRDPAIMAKIDEAHTGIGKRKLNRVVLTHSHYDHASLLPEIKERYAPQILAYSNASGLVDITLKGGESLKIGDGICEVIHTPGHTHDSICLFFDKEGILFVGDTPVIIRSPGGTYEAGFYDALKMISQKEIKAIYFGHGPPMRTNCNTAIRLSLDNVRKSHIIPV